MSGCEGLHCEGCGHRGGPAGAVIVLLVMVALALRKAWPQIVAAVEITAWTVAAVTGAAVTATCGVLILRAVRRRRARRAVVYRPGPVIPAARLVEHPVEPPAGRPAIGGPQRHRPGLWPLPGWREDIGPHLGGDGDARRSR